MSSLALLHQLEPYLATPTLGISKIALYVRLATLLKNDILLPQPHQGDPTTPPLVLPPSVVEFLGTALGLPSEDVSVLWETLKDDVWHAPPPLCVRDDYLIFKEHGWDLGLSEFVHTFLLAVSVTVV
jgi:hypothetical protein